MKTPRLSAVAILAILATLAPGQFAQAAEPTGPTLTFNAAVTNNNGSLATRLTWSTTPAAGSCTASGHANWTGTKPASGTADLPTLTSANAYTLTLACTWPADNSARLTWTAPTEYTDGSAIPAGGLALYKIYQGTSAGTISFVEQVPATSTTTTRTGLPAGTHYFAVTAVTPDGRESDRSGVGSKTITDVQSRTASVTLTVPRAPSITVQ